MQTAGHLLGSAGAGLAFANLPGQDIGFAAATGAALGGPKGAALAAAVASLAKLGSLAPGVAKTSAEIERLEVALTNVAGSRSTEAFAAIAGVVDDFNAPLKEATGNFTQLLAAAQSAGFTVAETEQVFRGLPPPTPPWVETTKNCRASCWPPRRSSAKARWPPKNCAGKSASDCLERSANLQPPPAAAPPNSTKPWSVARSACRTS